MEKCAGCPLLSQDKDCICQTRKARIYCKFMEGGAQENKAYIPIVLEMSNAKPLEPAPEEEPSAPGLFQSMKNLAGSVVDVAKDFMQSGELMVPPEEQQRRFNLCKTCPFFLPDTTQCKKCGCLMSIKTHLKAAYCPLENPKWTAYEPPKPVEQEKPSECGCSG